MDPGQAIRFLLGSRIPNPAEVARTVDVMSRPAIGARTEGCVTILTIERPEVRNALDEEGWIELRDRVRDAVTDPEVRALVLTGSGDKAFCAGADLRRPLLPRAQANQLGDIPPPLQAVREMEQSRKPILAAINGDAVGGGLELALACHIRRASTSARFGLPEIRFGLVPAAARNLPHLISSSRAFELLLTGELVTASEMLALGLVSHVIAPSEILTGVLELAHAISRQDPTTVAGVLALARSARGISPDAALRAAATHHSPGDGDPIPARGQAGSL